MCGILGAVDKNNLNLEDRVRSGIQKIIHRGPDGQGSEVFKYHQSQICLAHRRLSIIDLSDLAKQPMCSTDERFWITFNGEIYNYKELREELIELGHTFKSTSDTEVLINSWSEWGEGSLVKFKGMFAFTLFDKKENCLFCARDAFGIKPFFFTLNENSFYFSSEEPALLEMLEGKVKLNDDSVIQYLLNGLYDHSEETFIEEVKSLEPGTFLKIELKDKLLSEKKRWWKPSLKEDRSISFEEAANHLRKLFLESVRIHMRSDVPIGAALSGGIDSSAIVCAMRHLEPDMPIHTFSYIADEEAINEESWIDLVNNHVNAIPHKIRVNSEELLNDINDLTIAQGEPFGSTSIYAQYQVFKCAKDSGVKVVLEGQGADELMAGYLGYPFHRALSLLENYRYLGAYNFLKRWSKLHGLPIKPIFKSLIQKKAKSFLTSSGLYGLRQKQKELKNPIMPIWLKADKMKFKQNEISKDTRQKGRRLIQELNRSVMGHAGMGLASLLRHGDRNAMKWGVEGRVPFLTTEIAEFLFSLPEEYLISDYALTKNIFRESMRGIVPNQILDRIDKIGFATPEKDLTRRMVNNDFSFMKPLNQLNYLDFENVQNEVESILEGKQSFNWFPWRVINLSLWLTINSNSLKKSYVSNKVKN